MSHAPDILRSLSLRERVGQLNQRLYGWDCVRRTKSGWELTDAFHAELERWSGMGALYGLFRADAWSGRDWTSGVRPEERVEVAALVQEAAVGASRHGIGVLLSEEAPHGHQALGASLLPVNLAGGATWDPALMQSAAEAVSASMRAQGVHLALVSTLDVLRDGRWGRSEECFGESPLLAAEMTAAVVRGMQGRDRSAIVDGTGVGVVLKHFAGQGDGLGGRNGQSAQLGLRDLREVHLAPARVGVAEGALGVMAAYTDIDGVPCIADRALLTGILRDEWGFDGLVMADGKAIDRLIAQLGSPLSAGAAALAAGVDLSLWDESFAHLEEAAERLPALAGAIDAACLRVLSVKEKFGLLESVSGDSDPASARRETIRAADDRASAAAREIAARSLVLLQNHDALPVMQDGGRWAVIGLLADEATALLGDYVPPLREGDGDSVLAAIRRRASERGAALLVPPVVHGEIDDAARAELSDVDQVFVVLGGTSHREVGDVFAENGAAVATSADTGEGVDRADLRLPHRQDSLVRAIRGATDAPVIAIVVTGRPYVLTEVAANADAILFAAYPGPGGAEGIAQVMFGERQPVGRTVATLPSHPGVAPVHHDDRHATENVYADVPTPVFRRLGSGAGYAAVRGEIVECSVDGDVRIRVALSSVSRSIGWTGGAEDVVQVYARRSGGVVVPRRAELVAFQRVALDAQERREISISIPVERVFLPPDERAPLAETVTHLTVIVGGEEHSLMLTV